MSRPRPTPADYVVIAISPVLIMALVGSLVFFLLAVFHHGLFAGRLRFIMAMFVMAAVLIGRISVDEGREYAALFAIPLGIATILAAIRFVPVSPLISAALIGLIWWCADRLTWDCTVIDDSQDASGEGLLQTVGMDRDPAENESVSKGNSVELEAMTTREQNPPGLWQQFIESRRRPHRHGVWVVYFSLAALPIFGLGHCFIDGDDLASRRYVLKLLIVYVAAALGLLLTTSFLRLRHYLRQRRLQMPTEMVGVWMSVGATMIVALLLLCLLLPRRNPEYSITQLPLLAKVRDDLSTSKYAFGHDGPLQEDTDRSVNRQDEDTPADRQGSDQQPSHADKSSSQSQSETAEDEQDGGSGREDGSHDTSSEGEPSSGDDSQPQTDKSPPEEATNHEDESPQQSDKNRTKAGDANGTSESAERDSNAESGAKHGSRDRDGKDSSSENQRNTQTGTPEQPPPSSPNRMPDPSRLLSTLLGGLGQLMRLAYWLIVILVVAYLLWRHRSKVFDALQEFMASLRQLWQRLFGARDRSSEAAEDKCAEPLPPPPRPFADFQNPFLSGAAERWSADQLVKYSYEALEAWARERGCQRSPEQTPHEFAHAISLRERSLGRSVFQLAELYNLSAYAQQMAPAASVAHLRQLWQALGS